MKITPPPLLSTLLIDVDKDWEGRIIRNLGAPVAASDAARRAEVDAHAALDTDIHGIASPDTIAGIADIDAHAALSEGIHGLAAGEYLAKTTRADQLVTRTGPIREIEVAADTNAVDLTGLDINAHRFYLLLAAVRNPLTSGVEYRILFEGDTLTTNYYSQILQALGSSVNAARYNRSIVGFADAGTSVVLKILVMLDPDGLARAVTLSCPNAPANVRVVLLNVARTVTQTNLTSIMFEGPTGSIAAGSRFRLLAGRVE